MSASDTSSPAKRQKIAQQDNPIHDMGIVVLKHRGLPIANVPVLNFQTFATNKTPDLQPIVTETGDQRWKFYTYDISVPIAKRTAEQWASWLTNWDLRAVIDGGSEDGDNIFTAMDNSELMDNVDYQDALLDAWMSWLQDGEPAGRLNVDRLQDQIYAGCSDRLTELICALILYHNASAVVVENGGDPNEEFAYSDNICIAVRNLALNQFSRIDRRSKDPLQLSDDEFCKEYHSHHEDSLPCYKTKKLPEQSQV